MSIKFDLYEENGVKEYWIVNPTEKVIFIYKLQNNKFAGQRPLTVDYKMNNPLLADLVFDVNDFF